tara:strand:+ start:1570 stop:2190 length:621 start_codon:yes stop_codon:yes gene_type:complete
LFSILGYHAFGKVYKKAFTHKSANNIDHNERLEFLGDSILSFIITDLLFSENSKKEEGFLSQKRAKIVSRKHLNLVGKKIIPKEKINNSLENIPSNVYGNTLEAIIGAIYIDKGIKEAREFIKKHIYNSVFLDGFSDLDFKSRLLKHAQKEGLKIEYKVEKKEGLDHEKEFLVALFLNNKKITSSSAKSKKEAEQKAAKKAINIVF